MKIHNYQTGRLAEELATQALKKKGYLILENNFSNRFGEIDIIAKDHETLVFVEVKAKKGLDFGLPEEMISQGKLKKIQHMAIVYMRGQNLTCRIDVIAIVLSQNNELVSLNHYQSVYL